MEYIEIEVELERDLCGTAVRVTRQWYQDWKLRLKLVRILWIFSNQKRFYIVILFGSWEHCCQNDSTCTQSRTPRANSWANQRICIFLNWAVAVKLYEINDHLDHSVRFSYMTAEVAAVGAVKSVRLLIALSISSPCSAPTFKNVLCISI